MRSTGIGHYNHRPGRRMRLLRGTPLTGGTGRTLAEWRGLLAAHAGAQPVLHDGQPCPSRMPFIQNANTNNCPIGPRGSHPSEALHFSTARRCTFGPPFTRSPGDAAPNSSKFFGLKVQLRQNTASGRCIPGTQIPGVTGVRLPTAAGCCRGSGTPGRPRITAGRSR